MLPAVPETRASTNSATGQGGEERRNVRIAFRTVNLCRVNGVVGRAPGEPRRHHASTRSSSAQWYLSGPSVTHWLRKQVSSHSSHSLPAMTPMSPCPGVSPWADQLALVDRVRGTTVVIAGTQHDVGGPLAAVRAISSAPEFSDARGVATAHEETPSSSPSACSEAYRLGPSARQRRRRPRRCKAPRYLFPRRPMRRVRQS